jgi:hypothetical protein
MFSDLILSTITVESKLSNIKFKEKELIEDLNINEKNDIIKIGCNFNEYISDLYLEMTKPVKKSNRGRKKKIKPISTRKIQGNGKYFNSQITFTILDNEDKNKFYHLKLFTNGTIQIPFVNNENILYITPIINKIITLLNDINYVKIENEKNIDIIYIKSIMRNYKFHLIENKNFIDLYILQDLLLNYKSSQDIYNLENNPVDTVENKSVDDLTENENNEKLEINKKYLKYKNYTELYKLELTLIKFFPERYTGIILKFKTPIEENKNKLTTVKIFSSGKINIDGSNSLEESNTIKNIITCLIDIHKDEVLYTKD